MTLQKFTDLITETKRYQDRFSDLYKLGVNLLDLNDDYYAHVVDPLMTEAFGEDGAEMIEWFMYERKEDWGKDAARDKDGNPICYDIPSLYKYVSENK